MNLLRGRQLAIAPNFHLPATWVERLHLASGTLHGEPNPLWRSPTQAELALLVLDDSAPVARETLVDCLCLFQIPAHLRATFWAILEQFGELPQEQVDRFVAEIRAFLDFKQLPVPSRAVAEVTVNQPGKAGVFRSAPDLPIWSMVNLDEEATSVVYLNLSAVEVRNLTADAGPDMGLTERFLTTSPAYPPVRLLLGPGEGVRLPLGGLPVTSHTIDKQGPDVMLIIRSE